MKYFFHQSAAREFMNAVDYYEECRTGLGLEFASEINAAIQRILQYPESWTPLSKNTRRCLVNRFPFGVIYTIESNKILIIAVADLRKRPDYWLNRQ